jgi:DNA-binding MarR family transcriptional regulator
VQLALLLVGGYQRLVDEVTAELERRGHPDFRASHEYALEAVAGGATTISAVGRRLGVSKQAAAKTVSALVERGYLSRTGDPDDARSTRLELTAGGREVTRLGAEVFDTLRQQWAERVGPERVEEVERLLRDLVGDAPVDPGAPGWVSQVVG